MKTAHEVDNRVRERNPKSEPGRELACWSTNFTNEQTYQYIITFHWLEMG